MEENIILQEEKDIKNENNNKLSQENIEYNNQEFLNQIEKIDNNLKNNTNQSKINNQNILNASSGQAQSNVALSTNDNLKARIVKKNSLDGDVSADLRNPMSDSTQVRIVEKNNLEGEVIADVREKVYDYKEEKPREITKSVVEIIKPIMTIENVIVAEGNGAVFNVNFDKSSNKSFKVSFAPLINGSAQSTDIDLNIIVKDSKANIIQKDIDGNYSIPVGETNLRVEVLTNNDTTFEGNETFSLSGKTEFMTSTVFGIGTLVDDGSLSNGLNDDRPLSVNNVIVNEGSPYAIFEVSGASNQLASLSLANQNNDGSNLSTLEYFNGTNWTTYVSGNVSLDSNGKLLVRVALNPEQDTAVDGPETFSLIVTNTSGLSGSGLGTIKDDGTGSYFAENNNTKDSNVPNGIVLDDDRVIETDIKIAQFSDNYVNGLQYYTTSGLEGLSGDAGDAGSFRYKEGDTITFKVGNITVATFSADAVHNGLVFIQDITENSLSNVNADAIENIAIFLQALDSDLVDSDMTDGILHTNGIVNSNDSYSSNIVITEAIRDAFRNYIDPTTNQALNIELSGKTMISDALATVGIELTRQSEATNSGNNVFETQAMQHVVNTIELLAGDRTPSTFDTREFDIIEEGTSVINYNFVNDVQSGNLVIEFNAMDLLKNATPQQEAYISNMEVTDVAINAQYANLGVLSQLEDGTYRFTLNSGVTPYDLEGLSIDYRAWDWSANKMTSSTAIDTYKSHLSAEILDVTEGINEYNQFTLKSSLTFDTDSNLEIVFTSENLSSILGKAIAEYGDDYLVPIEYSTDGGSTWNTMTQSGIVYNELNIPMPQFEFVLPANMNEVEIKIPIFDDLNVESTEYFQATITGNNFYDELVEFKIFDNDPTLNTLPIIDIDYVYAVEGMQNAIFNITLSAPSTQTITVDYSTIDFAAKAGEDYVGVSGTLTFAPGETSKQIFVPIIDDLLDENTPDPEMAIINLSNATNAVIGDAQGTLRIFDNDPISDLPNITVNDVSVTEGTSAQFIVNFDSALQNPTNLNLSLSNGSATLNSDYSQNMVVKYLDQNSNLQTLKINSQGDVYVPAGIDKVYVSIPTITDSNFENNETFSLNASTVKNQDSGTGTITDISQPTVSIAVSPVGVSEGDTGNGNSMTYTVSLTNASAYDTKVYVSLSGTATTTTDYTISGLSTDTNGTYVTISAGQTTANFTATTVVDNVYEGAETIIATISSPTTNNETLTITTSSVTGRIYDDGSSNGSGGNYETDKPTLTLSDGIVEEGSTIVFAGTLSNASEYAEEITLSTILGTAESIDFNQTKTAWTVTYIDSNSATQTLSVDTNGKFTLPAGITSFNVNIPTTSDNVYEGSETFTLSASATSSYITDSDTASGTITDDGTGVDGNDTGSSVDDDKPTLTLSDGIVEEGSTIVFAGTLSNASEYAEEITLSTILGTAESIDFNQTKTAWTVTYIDSNSATQTLSVDTNGKFTLPAGITSFNVNIPTTSDNVYEGSETFTLSASATSSYITDSDTASGTITDDGTGVDGNDTGSSVDDDKPTLTLSDGIVEEGSTIVFAGTLSNASEYAEEITLSTILGTAESIDFNQTKTAWTVTYIDSNSATQTLSVDTNGKFTLPAGITSFNVNIPTTSDNVYEGSETFTLSASATSSYITDSDTASGTITDDGTGVDGNDTGSSVDDDKPTLTLSDGIVEEGSTIVFAGTLSNASEYAEEITLSTILGTAESIDFNQTKTAWTVTYIDSNSATQTLSVDTNGKFTLPAGITSFNVNIPTTSDNVYEGSETFTLSASATSSYITDSDTASGTITDDGTGVDGNDTGSSVDDDKPTLTLSDGIVEEGSTIVFAGTLSNASEYAEEITLSTILGTAESIDFNQTKTAWTVTYIDSNSATQTLSVDTNGKFTLPAGITSFNVNIPTTSDNVYEGSETFTLSASATSSYITDSDTASGTITDDGTGVDGNDTGSSVDDDKPTLTLSDGIVEEGSTIVFAGTLSNASEYAEEITLSTILGTAESIDFNQTKTAWTVTYIDSNSATQTLSVDTNGKFTLPAGITSFNVNIPTTSDNVYEGSETFTLSASATSSYITDSDTASGTITDDGTGVDGNDTGSSVDDDKPTLTLSDGIVEEGSTIVFAGTLSNASEYAEEITLSTILGTAESIDFNQTKTAWTVTYIDSNSATQTLSVDTNGKFTLPAGITSFNVNIPTTSDNVYEGSETFTLSASATSSYITDSDTASGTITDDGTGVDGNDTGSSVDDDKPTLTLSDGIVEEGSTIVFAGTLSNASEYAEEITLSTILGTAESIDFNQTKTAWTVTYIDSNSATQTLSVDTNGKFTLPAGITSFNVNIPTTSDNVYEGSETFTLSASATSSYITDSDTASGTITDDGTGVDGNDTGSSVDDDKPTLTLSDGIVEEGSTIVFAGTLSNASEYAEEITLSTILGTAESIDFNQTKTAWTVTYIDSNSATQTLSVDTNGKFTLPAGITSFNVNIPTTSDNVYEGSETFTLSASATSSYITDSDTASGTITDDGTGVDGNDTGSSVDDDKPTLTLSDGIVEEGSTIVFAGTLSNASEYAEEITLSTILGTAESIDFNQTKTAWTVTYIDSNSATQTLSVDTNGKFTLPAGITSFNVNIPTTSDNVYEGSETFTLSASATSSYITDSDTASGTITDDGTGVDGNDTGSSVDDDKPTLTLSDGIVEEGSTIVFAGTLSNASEYAEEITLSTILGTAESIDFNQTKTAWTVTYIDSNSATQTLSVDTNGKFTLPAGITSFNVNIPTTSDNVYEGSETFTLSASTTSSYITDSDTASGSITDKPNTTNDSITTNEDTTYTFTVNDFGTFGTLDTGISLTKVKILSLPTDGIIKLNGIDISDNTEILLSDISSNKLTFVPNSETDNDSSFTFQVGNATVYSNTQTTTVNIIAVADTPTTTLSVSAYSGSYVTNSASAVYASAISTTTNTNDTTTATFSNIKTGVVYSTSFNYIDASSTVDSGKVDVYWGNQLVTTIDGDNTMSRTATFDLVGGAGDGLNQLKFVASGTETNVNGVQISNIYMAPTENMLEYNVDLSAALNTADRADASENLVIKLSGYTVGTTFSVGYAETSSQLDVVLNTNTLQPTGNWIIPLTPITDDTFSNNSIKMYVPESADTFTLTSTAYAVETNDNAITPSTATSTVTDYSLNTAPTSTADTISVIEDTTYVLKVNDFGTYSDVNNDAFTSIKITSLPIHGVIRLLGHDKMGAAANISAGDEILVSDLNLGNLIYIPNSQYSGADTFNFKVGDGRSFSSSSYTTTVGVTAVADMPTISLNIGTATNGSISSGSSVNSLTLTDDFQSGLGNWSGTNVSRQTSGTYDKTMKILKGATATSEFNLGSDYAGKTVTISFKVTGAGGMEATGQSVDKLVISKIDATTTPSTTSLISNYTNSLWDGTNDKTEIISYTTTVDSSGKLKISLYANSSGNNEDFYIDDFTVTYTSSNTTIVTKDYPITITDVLGVDKDGSETLGNVTLSGIPTGSSLYANGTLITVTTNTATLTQSQITAGNIVLKIPSTSSQAFSLSASVTSTESSNSDSKTATATAEHVTGNTTPVTTNLVADLVTTSSVSTNTPTNIIVIMDVSGSMSTTDSGTSGSRLTLAKNAITSMIDAYSALGTVNVNLTSFQATATSFGWKTAENAKTAINALASGGYTNYEDALYKTYSTYSDINPSAKTIVLFVSDGEPTRENLEGRDVTGDIGLDAQSGWLDSTYKTAWQAFVNANIEELKVVGIGSGLTNTTYLSQVAEGINSSVITDVVHLKNTADLSSYVAPNVDSISGNVLSNIDYKADGAGGIKSIVVNGTTYDSNNSTEVTALSNGVNTASSGSYGKLTFDFTTGDYKYITATATTLDRVESFAITVADSNGDMSTFNLNIQVFNSVIEHTYIDNSTPIVASTGYDSLLLGNGININFDSIANIDNFEQIDLTKNANHSLSNIELQDILDITDSNHLFRVLGDSGDNVGLKNTANATWSKNGSTDTNGFDTYINNGNNSVSLKIDSDITVSII